ncbi:MAG: PAS domain-containing protein, partial [Candidatus Kariarchaeaceae archaeon]
MEKLNLETTKEQLESIFLVLKENIPQSKGIDEYGSLIVSTLQPVIGNFNFTILMMNPTDKFLPDKPVFRYLINPTHSVDTISPRAARLRISESILLFRLLEKCEPQFFSSVDYLVETEKPNFLTFPASSLFFLPLYDEKPAFGYILLWALETDGFIDYTEDQLEFLQKVVTTSMPILRSFYYREIGFATTEYFNQLFSRAKDLVFVLKDDGTIINVNKVVESILGYVPFDIIGHPFSKFIKTPINLDRSLDLEEYEEVEFYYSSEDLVPMEINFWSQAE